MDAPLLALTRRPARGLPGRSPVDTAADNMRQLVQLRWIAVAGQVIAILLAHFGLGVRLPLAPMLLTAAVMASANLLFTLTLAHRRVLPAQFLLALLMDVAALTLQLYLSGGAANPFVSLLLLQVVLGAILLPLPMAALLAAAACVAFALLTARHLPLMIPAGLWNRTADLMTIGQWVSFVMVAALLMVFITRISRNLRARDAYVAELGQRAAEEDGIVRMGLFASGAAHELGTPLSTLAVLVADWQRDPRLSVDPGLREELAEAQSEIARCKAIVSNILHSAGQARGEAMGSAEVTAVLSEVAEAWSAAHPGFAFELRQTGVEGVYIAADPALRQAIWSLLENALEADADAVALSAAREGELVVIAIEDTGPGFSPSEIASIGTLYQSTKGPGHGLGLFLAVNVARRLGGRLEAANAPGGGALVRLLLPVLRDTKES